MSQSTSTKSAFSIAADLIDPLGEDGWTPLPHQIPPQGKWFIWLLLGGRGSGKTAAAAHDMHEHVMGPPCLKGVPGGHWPSIIAPTLGDGVTSCVNGPSGLRVWEPGIKVRVTPGGTVARWPNGCEAKIFGAHTPEDVERLRSGGNRCYVWAEEMCAWRYLTDCWEHMRYGLRVGPWPHVVISTTPKSLKMLKSLVKRAEAEKTLRNPYIVVTRATTNDNPHLDARVKSDLFEDYGGTRMGRQELNAEILEDVEGALWTPEDIELWRLDVGAQPPRYLQIAVGVDPQAKEGGDNTGIVIGAVNPNLTHWGHYPTTWPRADNPHFFVLGDYSVNGRPEIWGKKVVDAMNDYEANFAVAEINNGGDMVEHTIHMIDDTIPVHKVTATRGKDKRAEPVSALYQQGRGHHVGQYAMLEDEMTSWDSIEPDPAWSPDRMDAMVWVATELVVKPVKMRRVSQAVTPRLSRRR